MIEPELNQDAVNVLIQQGASELCAKHAVYNANGDAEMAMMWMFENMENPVI